MKLRNFSITDRMTAGFGLMLLILAGSLAYSQYLFSDSAAVQRELAERIVPRTEAANRLEQSVLYVGIGVRGYLLLGGSAMRERHMENMRQVRAQLQAVQSMTQGDAPNTALQQATAASTAFLAVSDSIVTNARQFDGNVELALRERREAVLVPLRTFVEEQRALRRVALDDMSTARRRLQQGLVYALIVSLVLAIIVAYFTSQSVRKPTLELLGVADALRNGDWKPARRIVQDVSSNGQSASSHRNELVRLGQAFGSAGISLEQRDRRLRSMNVVCAATSASLDGVEIATAVLDEMCAYVDAQAGVVYLRDHEQERLSPLVVRALDPSLPSVRFREGIVGQAAATRKAVVVQDFPDDTPFEIKLGIDAVPPRSVAAIPFSFDNQLLGVVVVASVRDQEPSDIEFLEFSAAQLSIGIENVRAYQTVQQLLSEVGAQREQIAEQFEQLQGQHEELQAQHEEMQAQSEELQAQSEEIHSQNEELQAQSNALVEADEQKNRFLGLLAHELRNPMAAISNSLYLLSQADGDSSLPLRARSIIERQTKQLTRLVDDLLDITRIAKGKLHIERAHIDFAPIVRDCVEDHRTVANAAGVSIECVLPETSMPVYGDAVRLRQVIGNLLDNAIKFCHSGGSIRVWGDVPAGGGEVVLTVTDDGIGIDPALHDQLFRPFMQADPTRTRSKGGLGLGLSLVRAYVTLHAGTVDMRSNGAGTGCAFTVRLPVSTSFANDAMRPDSKQATVSTPPRRVLVIEDNEDGAESLRDALALDGHDVRVATTVDHALEVAETFTPDVALCDVGLPGADGYEFARRARQDRRLSAMRIVALTGYAAPDDKQAATDAGFDGHITKPANITEIRSLLALG